MRAGSFINFVVVSSASVLLFGVITKTDLQQSKDFNAHDFRPSKYTQAPDTPEVDEEEVPELLYPFKDNDGRPPMYDPQSKLYLEPPSNIKSNVVYDPVTGNYNITQKVGERDYRKETYMSLDEYKDYMYKKQMRDYWRSRVAADELNSQPRKGMIPKLQVNSELFDRIFGGNTVDIKPTGTAELIFGLNRNKNLNPAIPQKQQKVTNFDFNMRIQLNLIGKIGDKLKITTNYNTEASFDWENQVKVDYTGYEDEIIKKIEAGNVTLPLNSSLISGSQTLFGFKTTLQFGKLTATSVFSQQNGKKQEITVQGGAQMQTFNITADNYEQNKHYYLGHYFRTHYDNWMLTLPVINTPVVVNKVEVYLLGINGNAEQTRNIVAFEDLGESEEFMLPEVKAADISPSKYALFSVDSIPSNFTNNLYNILIGDTNAGNTGLISSRSLNDISVLSSSTTVNNPNNPNSAYMVEGRDFVKIQNARRLNPNEYTFNARTGNISLNQQLNNDQALAVSYQYTYKGKTYQVGDFSDQVPDNTKLLVCKLLKTNAVSVRHPMWRLMMKNVYALGAYNLNPQDFKLDVYYNNIETGVDVPYLPAGKNVNGILLIRVLNCDRLSVNGDRGSDGYYDFVNGYTIAQSNGRAYFPTEEPFGRSLEKKFEPSETSEINTYVFKELYDSTKTAASFIQSKNRFKIKGTYRSSSGSEIALNAINIPQGAVVVTANGVTLTENTDYTVDYSLGRVKIINDGILNSGATVKVSLESNSLFSVQQKSLWGTRLDYVVNRNLSLGSTFLWFNERPITQKVSIGDEPVSNIVSGLDFNYKSDVPFLTRILDKLPFYSTKEMSSITSRGEVAKLFPGNAKAIRTDGGNSYIDDFEGSISLIDIKGATSWYLASIPQGISGVFPEGVLNNDIKSGLNRARFNWYNVDAMFTRNQSGTTPGYYQSKKLFSNNMWRQVFETELFPGKTPPNGQQVVLPLLDIGFYPSERGPYNYDVNGVAGISKGINADGSLKAPETRWGGIMRRLETNDFQAANIEYIQFWMMDPFNEDYNLETDPNFDPKQLPKGDLFINLGNISEDVLKDGRMVYENGIPGQSDFAKTLVVDTTNVGNVPVLPPIINAFSQDNNDRPLQDVGFDGLSDDAERARFAQAVADMQNGAFDQAAKDAFISDPSSDRYNFFRDDQYDEQEATTLTRYAKYNNPEGNSPTEAQYQAQNKEGYPTGATNLPNIEDVNKDNTLNTVENYYQYRVKISPSDVNPNSIGTNYIVDAFDGSATFSGVTKTVKWYQFKIPISQFESNVGGIEGFNSIRFMRVYMKGFNRPVLVRLARFELVRSDWRKYQFDLKEPGDNLSHDENDATFDVSAVSLQENSSKIPVNYVMPPSINQQQNVQTTNLVLLNEQALSMRVCDLRDGDSRAIFKNVPELDTRMFENIKMNVHAEKYNNNDLNDGDLTLFFRVGSDYNSNFYEYEIPLKLTPKGVYNPNSDADRLMVWPTENEVNLKFSDISIVKDERNREVGYYSNLNQLSTPYSKSFGAYTISIVGNPNLGNVKSIMVGIRNRRTPDKLSHCAEVWINELRLTQFNNEGGWATTGQVQAKLADLGMLNLSGTYKSPFWGSVESKINERSKETNANWDMSTSINAGKFFPDKLKVTLPIFYNFGRTKITPLFNPLDPDVRMSDLKNQNLSDSLEKAITDQTIDFTERKGFNLSNVRIDGLKRPNAKPMPLDVSNFSFTYAYNEIFRRNVNIEYNYTKQFRGNIQYAYALKNPYTLKPFTQVSFLQNKWFSLIKDFNLQLLPNSFGMSVDVNRNYVATKNRDITSFYNSPSDSVGAFQNNSLVNKNYTMTRNYNLMWSLTKAIKYDYMAANEGRIMEFNKGEDYKQSKDAREQVRNTFFKGSGDTIGKFGENTSFRQQMNVNAEIPINKIPIFDFVRVNYRYGGTYTWTRRSFAAENNVGNTIQNTGSHNLTGNFNLVQLYNKIPYLRNVNSPVPKKARSASNAKEENAKNNKGALDANGDPPEKTSNFKDIGEFLAKTLMMLKTISVTGELQRGQALPNFKPTSQYLGMDFSPDAGATSGAPGFMFVSGLYDKDIRNKSARNGWLTDYDGQTTPYIESEKTTFTYKANVEPHKSLKIELNGNYSKMTTLSEYIQYDPNISGDIKYDFHVSPSNVGTYNISTVNMFGMFKDGKDPYKSALFDEFRNERRNIAEELGKSNNADGYTYNVITYTNSKGQTSSYVDGYSDNQQDVLLGAFNRIYNNQDVKNYNTSNIFYKFPLPNWTLTWDGLSRIKATKKMFSGITLRHAYRGTYNISGFTNNLLFSPTGQQIERMPDNQVGLKPNFVPKYTIGSVTMSERYDPLIKFDFRFNKPGWSANIETKRDKTTTLNLTGFQIIETKGQEYVLGLGYMIPKLRLNAFKIQGKALESNLTIRLDLSYRKNLTGIRQIETGVSTPTGGTNIITLRSSADYMLTQNITLRLFYDWVRTTPQTSASFPTSSTNGGFSLRINFQ